MRLEYHVHGEDRVVTELLRFGDRAGDARPALREVLREMREAVDDRFASEGRGDWPALAESTLRAKVAAGLPTQILVATSEMRDSLTQEGHGSGFDIIERDRLIFGSDVPYGMLHQRGTSKMPQRKVIEFSESDQGTFARTIQDWVVHGMAATV